MRIGILDADLMDHGTRHPNLALMKIAGYYKNKGDSVKLIFNSYEEVNDYDKVYISKVFNFTRIPEWVLKVKNVEIGGTGFYEDGGQNLPLEIEHHMPDYKLYDDYIKQQVDNGKEIQRYEDYLDFSIGFMTRGCFRKCSFCVNKKYDHVFRHSKVEEFLDFDRPKIYLWDDNFLAYPKWEECLNELEDTGKPFQFRQGIDLRLMNDRKAYRFNNTKWYGDFIFAFDNLEDKEIIIRNIQLWKKYTNKQPKLYVLSGFKSQDANDIVDVFERIKILMKYGCIPYIMRHENYMKSEYKGMYIQLARWCNQPQFYKKMSFREFCVRNQFYHKNKDTFCSAYKVMLDFENKHPKIAANYFDIKFMNENIYNYNYGTGHRYCNKQDCNVCIKKKMTWDNFVNGSMSRFDFLQQFLERELEIGCLNYTNSKCTVDKSKLIESMELIIKNVTQEECIEAVSMYREEHKFSSEDLIEPIYDVEAIKEILQSIVKMTVDGETKFKDYCIEYEYRTDHQKKVIRDIFHNLSIYDLLYFSKNTRNKTVKLTLLGEYYLTLSIHEQKKLLRFLSFRFPLLQEKYRRNLKDNGKKIISIRTIEIVNFKNCK